MDVSVMKTKTFLFALFLSFITFTPLAGFADELGDLPLNLALRKLNESLVKELNKGSPDENKVKKLGDEIKRLMDIKAERKRKNDWTLPDDEDSDDEDSDDGDNNEGFPKAWDEFDKTCFRDCSKHFQVYLDIQTENNQKKNAYERAKEDKKKADADVDLTRKLLKEARANRKRTDRLFKRAALGLKGIAIRDKAISDELEADGNHDSAKRKQKTAKDNVKKTRKEMNETLKKNKKPLQDALKALRDCLKKAKAAAEAAGGSCNLAYLYYLDEVKKYSGQKTYEWLKRHLGLNKKPSEEKKEEDTKLGQCETKKSCSALASCNEAQIQFSVCGNTNLDGDGDGVPCESLCKIEPELQLECGEKKTCGEMSSCTDAMFHFNSCGLKRLDGDGDGIPCEALCG